MLMRAVRFPGLFVFATTLSALAAAQRTRAANIVIPSGVSGKLTMEFTFTEADFVNAVGIVSRPGGGSPVYTELLNTSTTRVGRRIFTTNVTGGQVIELYLESNKAGLPGFTHAFYSSNPTFNATLNPGVPEHVKQPQQTANQIAHNVWVIRWEDKNSADPGYDADFNDVVMYARVNGDRDGDGLWDDWETNGIDADGDGTWTWRSTRRPSTPTLTSATCSSSSTTWSPRTTTTSRSSIRRATRPPIQRPPPAATRWCRG